MFAGPETLWISSDRRTKFVYDKGAGTLTTYVEGVAIMTIDADAALIDLQAVTATPAEINNAADVSARVEEHTASGAVTAGIQSVEINSVAAVSLTIADAADHQGLFIVKHTSSSSGQSHLLTLTAGTFNGSAGVQDAVLNAANEALVVYFDSAGNGTIVENIGSVSVG